MSELHPDQAACQTLPPWSVHVGIPPELSRFARYPNVPDWRPGDLILTRELQPDGIGTLISDVQRRAGYTQFHSCWTHAAMYLGDGKRVIEATVDGTFPALRGDVRLTQLWDYCNGEHALRVRRPIACKRRADLGLLMVVEALQLVKKKYDILGILKFAAKIKFWSKFWIDGVNTPMDLPLVCSTFYAHAHIRATRVMLGEENGMCTPALLSVSEYFEDVTPLRWRSLDQHDPKAPTF